MRQKIIRVTVIEDGIAFLNKKKNPKLDKKKI